MRILYLDLDTLRPDHLGCYGYLRNTSPNIDRIASEGVRFENYYTPDAPCLPSRASLFNGRFGIHTGVVGHGGTTADLRLEGRDRSFASRPQFATWMTALEQAGLYTVSVSSFADRHAAWWFNNGFRDMYNPGKGGGERADEVAPYALRWIKDNAQRDNWFLQVNFWDPHTPYRTPMEYGNPFEGEPVPDWLTEDILDAHRKSYGPHSACEPWGFDEWNHPELPRVPKEIASLDDFRKAIDGYDVGIRYMDDHIGTILDTLEAKGVLDETTVIISSDHGENLGELNIYGDHHTADHITSRVPLIVRWPGMKGGTVDHGLHYNLDLAATVTELVGATATPTWDGESFAPVLQKGDDCGRDYLVVSQCAWSCQRAVRWGPWILVRTYHDGFKNFPEVMLFNLENDPHETRNIAADNRAVVNEGIAKLEHWHGTMMETSDYAEDPLWTVMREGGPFHTRGMLAQYCNRLRETGRGHHADKLERQYTG
jgi:choline-sulfatase